MTKQITLKIYDTEKTHHVRSDYYNYDFSKISGLFRRWGKTEEDDPICAPLNEILDIEVSTICNGIGTCMEDRKPCAHCYKSNTGKGVNMSFDVFKDIIDKQLEHGVLCQVAFGIGDLDANPDLKNMILYCLDNEHYQIIPNITINGMGLDDEWADFLANHCGAVSVSRYHLPEVCYSAVKKLSLAGLEQVNIHQVLSEEHFDQCFQVLEDIENDEELKQALNAIVFLALKKKGRGVKFNRIDEQERLFSLYDKATEMGINFGTDSCAAPTVLKWATARGKKELLEVIECCESSRMSLYIDVFGRAWPCSFCEDVDWISPIDVKNGKYFVREVWDSRSLNNFRGKLIVPSCSFCEVKEYCFSCPVYDITPCKEE